MLSVVTDIKILQLKSVLIRRSRGCRGNCIPDLGNVGEREGGKRKQFHPPDVLNSPEIVISSSILHHLQHTL